MRSLYAVVVRAIDRTVAGIGRNDVFTRVWSYRGRLMLLAVLALPLIVSACGGKKGGHGSSWG